MTAEAPSKGTVAHVILDRQGHDDADLVPNVLSLRLYLPGEDPGSGAEVQVAVVDGSLVLIASGHVLMDRDTRGFARLRIHPE